MLVDLDGTLVDRATAFAAWAGPFVRQVGGSDDDVRWLLDLDADGYAPRVDVARALQERFGLAGGVPHLVDRLLFEHVEAVAPYPGVVDGVRALRGEGAVVVVVTNGTVAQQERKLRVSGLLAEVDDVVVSEAVGVKKPDGAVFAAALEGAVRCGGTGRAWMLGDHPVADVAGGRASGLSTGWVSHGRPWPGGPAPDLSASTTAELLGGLLAAVRGPRDVAAPAPVPPIGA